MLRILCVSMCLTAIACGSIPTTAPRAGMQLSDAGHERAWRNAVSVGDPKLLAAAGHDIVESLWIRAVVAEAEGDEAAARTFDDERVAFVDEAVAAARRNGWRQVVTRVVRKRDDLVRHREDVIWALDREGYIEDASILAARRAYADDPDVMAQLPCRKAATSNCRRHFEKGDQARARLQAAGRERNQHDLERALAEVFANDTVDTWSGALRVLSGEQPRDDEFIFALAAEPEVAWNGKLVSIAVASLEALPESAPRKLALAHVLVALHDGPDAAVLARELVTGSAPYAELAGTLLAKAELLLGNPAAYLSWRDANAHRTSASLVRFESEQWVDGKRTELARSAMVRGIELADAQWAQQAVTATDLPIDARSRAVERLRLDDPGLAELADACVKGAARACDQIDKPRWPVPIEVLASVENVAHLDALKLVDLDSGGALADERLPALLSRLNATHHRRAPVVARARFARAVRDGLLDAAAGMLNEPDSGLDDIDALSAALLLADVRAGKTKPDEVRLGVRPGFAGFGLQRERPHGPSRVWSNDDPRLARLDGACQAWFQGDPSGAFDVFVGLDGKDLPPRAHSELVAHAIFSGLAAGRRADVERLMAQAPPAAGSVQDAACQGIMARESDPREALRKLGRAASSASAPAGVRHAFASSLVQARAARASDFARAWLEPFVDDDEDEPLLSEDELSVALRTLLDRDVIDTLPISSPVLAFFRSQVRFKLDERLMRAKAAEDIQSAAAELLARAAPASPYERAWLMVLAGKNSQAVAYLTGTPLSDAEKLQREEVLLVATERQSQGTPFDDVMVRQLWAGRYVKHADGKRKKDAKLPSWSATKAKTASGEEFLCRALMRHSQPLAGAEHCFRAWQSGQESGRLGDHMSFLIVEQPQASASRLVDGKAVFAEGAFAEAGYGYLVNKSTWLSQQPGSSTAEVARVWRDGTMRNPGAEFQLYNSARAAIAEHYPVLARAVASTGTHSWRRYLFIVGLLAVGDGNDAVVETARKALVAGEPSATEDPNGAAILGDIERLVEEDRRLGRADRRTVVESISAVAMFYGLASGVEPVAHRADIAKLASVLIAVRRGYASRNAGLVRELAVAHPENDTVALAEALSLVRTGDGAAARAYVSRRFPEANNPRRLELLKQIDTAEKDPRLNRRREPPAPTTDL